MASPYSSSIITSALQLASAHHKFKPQARNQTHELIGLSLTWILHPSRQGIMAHAKETKYMAESASQASQHCESFMEKKHLRIHIRGCGVSTKVHITLEPLEFLYWNISSAKPGDSIFIFCILRCIIHILFSILKAKPSVNQRSWMVIKKIIYPHK